MAKKIRKSRAKKRQEEALFRHQIISRVYALELGGAVRADAVRNVAGGKHFTTSEGGDRRISERRVYRWLAAYGDDGALASLVPAER